MEQYFDGSNSVKDYPEKAKPLIKEEVSAAKDKKADSREAKNTDKLASFTALLKEVGADFSMYTVLAALFKSLATQRQVHGVSWVAYAIALLAVYRLLISKADEMNFRLFVKCVVAVLLLYYTLTSPVLMSMVAAMLTYIIRHA